MAAGELSRRAGVYTLMPELDPEIFGEVERHESFGTISFSRISGSHNDPLFGSSITHNNMVMMEVHEAERRRHLHREWIHEGRLLLRLMLSPSQFAEAMINLNVGGGTPATLEYVVGDGKQRREPPPNPRVREQFDAEVGETVRDVVKRIDDAIEAARRVGDKDRLKSIRQQLLANLPFLEEQFARQMDKTVTEAKAEVEAFITAREQYMGVEAIQSSVVNRPALMGDTAQAEPAPAETEPER